MAVTTNIERNESVTHFPSEEPWPMEILGSLLTRAKQRTDHKRVFRSYCSCSAKSAVGFLPKGDQPSPQPCSVRSAGRHSAPTRTTASPEKPAKKARTSPTALQEKPASNKRDPLLAFAAAQRFRSSRNRTDHDTSRKKKIAATHIPFFPHSRPRSAPITLSHITLQHVIRTLSVCASQREVQDSACPSNLLDNLQRARRTLSRT